MSRCAPRGGDLAAKGARRRLLDRSIQHANGLRVLFAMARVQRLRHEYGFEFSFRVLSFGQLARGCGPVYREVVSPLENIVEELKSLPPSKLEVAADFVHRLKRISDEERQSILTRTAGALSAEEADEMEQAIEEGCERVDEDGW